MNNYELAVWMDKDYGNNLLRKNIIEQLFNNLIIQVKNLGLKIKNENEFYKNFLIYIYKYSN